VDPTVGFGDLWLALLVPFVIMLVKQTGFDDRINRLIAVGCYIIWAVIVTVGNVGLPGETAIDQWIIALLNSFAATIAVGTTVYQLILKQFGIDDKVTELTSFVKSPVLDEVVEDG
jgi:hypothetical protein